MISTRLRACALALLTLATGTLLAQAPALAASTSLAAKSDRLTLQESRHNGPARVIARLDGSLTPARSAELKSLGADIYRHLPIVDSVALALPARNLDALARLDWVTRISTDAVTLKCDEFTDDNSGATAAYQQDGLTGNGVTVAVLDSGVHATNDFNNGAILLPQSRVLANVNFVGGTPGTVSSPVTALNLGSLSISLNLSNSANPTDDTCGHGTHVAGIIAGNGASSSLLCYKSFTGIARKANLVNVRVLDGNGVSTVSTVVAGVQWIVANKAKYNIRVLNCSLGHPVWESYTTDPLCQALEQAWKAGIVVVCAAGNDGRLTDTFAQGAANSGYGSNYFSIESPGNDPQVITVGAMKAMNSNRADDQVASYSRKGPSMGDLVLKPDIIAPGNQVISVEAAGSNLAVNCATTNQIPYSAYVDLSLTPSASSNNYFVLSGTSMATPVISGAAALLLQANGNLSPDTIKARLMVSADKWTWPGGTVDPLTFGAGYVDIPAALKSNVVATEPALSPTVTLDANDDLCLDYDGAIWSSHAIWGVSTVNAQSVYGSHAIWGVNSVADSHAIWGVGTIDASHAIWGVNTTAVDLSAIAIHGE